MSQEPGIDYIGSIIGRDSDGNRLFDREVSGHAASRLDALDQLHREVFGVPVPEDEQVNIELRGRAVILEIGNTTLWVEER